MKQLIRRDFLVIGSSAAGLSLAAPAGSTQTWSERFRSSKPVEAMRIDLNSMVPGQELRVMMFNGPIAIRFRTQEEIEDSRATPMSELLDKLARNANLKADALATDENRSFGENGQWLVYRPICTHLGVITLPVHPPVGNDPHWINCPTHGGRYDAAGRVRAGPPDRNLPIPPVRLLSDGTIEIKSHDGFSNERQVREDHPSEW